MKIEKIKEKICEELLAENLVFRNERERYVVRRAITLTVKLLHKK